MEDDTKWHEDEEGLPPQRHAEADDEAHDEARNEPRDAAPAAEPLDVRPHDEARPAAQRDAALAEVDEHKFIVGRKPATFSF